MYSKLDIIPYIFFFVQTENRIWNVVDFLKTEIAMYAYIYTLGMLHLFFLSISVSLEKVDIFAGSIKSRIRVCYAHKNNGKKVSKHTAPNIFLSYSWSQSDHLVHIQTHTFISISTQNKCPCVLHAYDILLAYIFYLFCVNRLLLPQNDWKPFSLKIQQKQRWREARLQSVERTSWEKNDGNRSERPYACREKCTYAYRKIRIKCKILCS